MKVVVTGGSGKAGRAVVRHLLERGHEVLNVDVRPSPESYSHDSPAPFLAADLTDFGQAFEVLNGGAARMPAPDAVVHLAAIPSPVHSTPDLVFRTNVVTMHTVFAPAEVEPLELRRREPRGPERRVRARGRHPRGRHVHRGRRRHRDEAPERELMAEIFPDVPIRGDLPEHGTLIAIDKARRLLGYDPQFTWRELL